jgi:solute carrier family 13 (sodium-dependent dicarboxylate transporter), member 2/3/5
MIGCIAVTIVLSLVVPSATARSAPVVPIMMGIIAAFGVDKRSNIAAGIMIIVAQATRSGTSVLKPPPLRTC